MDEIDVFKSMRESVDGELSPFVDEKEAARLKLIATHKAWLKKIKKEYPSPYQFFKVGVYIRYKILKRKIFFENGKFDADAPAECVLGPNKTLLEVSDYQNYFENFCEKKGICPPDNDDVMYPCFAKDLALVKYTESDGEEHFSVCLCCESCKKSCGLIDYLYVLPLDGTTIRDHRFEDNFYDHDHIALPKATLASPVDLDETMRKNYLDFVAYWTSQTQASYEKKIAICDECGSEYLASTSKMASLCPECAHVLYGYENCNHVFKDGKCTLCLWDGSRSDYIKSLKQDEGQ